MRVPGILQSQVPREYKKGPMGVVSWKTQKPYYTYQEIFGFFGSWSVLGAVKLGKRVVGHAASPFRSRVRNYRNMLLYVNVFVINVKASICKWTRQWYYPRAGVPRYHRGEKYAVVVLCNTNRPKSCNFDCLPNVKLRCSKLLTKIWPAC